jgi:hypothetical protein
VATGSIRFRFSANFATKDPLDCITCQEFAAALSSRQCKGSGEVRRRIPSLPRADFGPVYGSRTIRAAREPAACVVTGRRPGGRSAPPCSPYRSSFLGQPSQPWPWAVNGIRPDFMVCKVVPGRCCRICRRRSKTKRQGGGNAILTRSTPRAFRRFFRPHRSLSMQQSRRISLHPGQPGWSKRNR